MDIALPLADRLRLHLDPGDELVAVPPAPEVAEVDVLIASRFSAHEGARVRFRMLQAPGAGTDKIDFAAVPPAAWICDAYEHEGPIAEYVFAAILDHAIGYGAMTRRIAEEGWGRAYFSRPPHGEVAGTTLGLVGLGHIGAAVAKRAKAFGMTVMALTASPRAAAENVDWLGTGERLDELLAAADYLVLACPLTEATRGLIGARELARMKPTALLINIARAEIADEAALYAALGEGGIGGAVLDAWYRYPASAEGDATPSRFPFGSLPNVRMTPHSAAWTDGVWARRCVVLARNIDRLRCGEPLLNVVRGGLRCPT
jgi:phosphoglycerate dehydrogenase-like enzyme